MSSTRRILGLDLKSKKQMKKKGRGGESKMITDERFASAESDPRFMEAPKRHSKVTIDSRFQRVFTDRSFTSSRAPVDKRGKSKKNNSQSGPSVNPYYRLELDQPQKNDDKKSDLEIGNETESDDDVNDDDDVQSVDESSSTSTTDSDDDNYVYQDEGGDSQEEDIPVIDKETRRLAVVELDWSHVRAVDLYALLSSFLPKEGQILSVSVYPSEFGLKRMKEEVHGPVGLFNDDDKNDGLDDDVGEVEGEHDDLDDDDDEVEGEDDDDDLDDDNGEIDQNKLRKYERSKLRYYFAVVECDSVATADYLYNTCDGAEVGRSANKLDLRFIKDSEEFKHEPRDVATEVPAGYEGLDFQTRALQHSNIHLTWDEDEPQRAKTLKRKFNAEQIADMELKEYLASSDSESDEDNNEDGVEDNPERKSKKLDKYRDLLGSGDGSDDEDEDKDDCNGQEMEVTFNSGLEELSQRIIEKKNKKSETVWDAYNRKKREKKIALKKERKGSRYCSDDESSEDSASGNEDGAEEADDFFDVNDNPAVGKKEKSVKGKKASKPSVKESEASIAELELLTADDKVEDSKIKGYNINSKKKRKGKKGEEIQDEDTIIPAASEDPRFAAIHTQPQYFMDPTDPQFKRSAAYYAQKKQKMSSRKKRDLK